MVVKAPTVWIAREPCTVGLRANRQYVVSVQGWQFQMGQFSTEEAIAAFRAEGRNITAQRMAIFRA